MHKDITKEIAADIIGRIYSGASVAVSGGAYGADFTSYSAGRHPMDSSKVIVVDTFEDAKVIEVVDISLLNIRDLSDITADDVYNIARIYFPGKNWDFDEDKLTYAGLGIWNLDVMVSANEGKITGGARLQFDFSGDTTTFYKGHYSCDKESLKNHAVYRYLAEEGYAVPLSLPGNPLDGKTVKECELVKNN